jgi:hypothetical protein
MSYKYYDWSTLMISELLYSFSPSEKNKFQEEMSVTDFVEIVNNNKPDKKELYSFLKSTPDARLKKKSWYSSFEKKLSMIFYSLLYLKCARSMMESFPLNLNGPYRTVIAQISCNAYNTLDSEKKKELIKIVYKELINS